MGAEKSHGFFMGHIVAGWGVTAREKVEDLVKKVQILVQKI